jgi:hypothetical protein
MTKLTELAENFQHYIRCWLHYNYIYIYIYIERERERERETDSKNIFPVYRSFTTPRSANRSDPYKSLFRNGTNHNCGLQWLYKGCTRLINLVADGQVSGVFYRCSGTWTFIIFRIHKVIRHEPTS